MRHYMKASLSIREWIAKVLLDKIPMKKPPIIDIELITTDFVKRKMILSNVGSTSSMTTKKVIVGRLKWLVL